MLILLMRYTPIDGETAEGNCHVDVILWVSGAVTVCTRRGVLTASSADVCFVELWTCRGEKLVSCSDFNHVKLNAKGRMEVVVRGWRSWLDL